MIIKFNTAYQKTPIKIIKAHGDIQFFVQNVPLHFILFQLFNSFSVAYFYILYYILLRRVECKGKKIHMFKIFLILSLKKIMMTEKELRVKKEKRGLPYVFWY